jgi:TfoX/Sxy family transcriptional regulator of competence genes
VVALVCDDQLFLKPTPEGLRYLGKVVEAPPYTGAKNHYLLESELDDPEKLGTVLQITCTALPEPKPKKAKKETRSVPKARAKRSRK